jgi:hypothetical protein
MKKLLKFIGIVVCIILFLQYRLYFSDAIEGWVVDIDTGEPLENVDVHIEWNVHTFSLVGGTGIGIIEKLHTVTDKNGYFYFPAWGPQFVRLSSSVYMYPRIEFTKKNYKTELFSHGYESLLHLNFLALWTTLNTNWCNSICCCKEKIALLKNVVRQ